MTAPVVATPAPPAVPPVSPERRTSQYIDRLLARHGSADAAMLAMSSDLFSAQDLLTTSTAEVEAFRRKLPDGAVVLPKAEAESYAKVIALKLTPDQLVERVAKAAELEGTVKRTELETLARKGAAQFGLDPDGLADYVVSKGLAAELRDATVTEGGKSVTKKVLHVRPASESNAPWKPAGEYVTTLAAHEQRALKATPTTTTTGVPHPDTAVDLAPTDGSLVADVQKFKQQVAAERAAKPNPLVPPKPALAGATQ